MEDHSEKRWYMWAGIAVGVGVVGVVALSILLANEKDDDDDDDSGQREQSVVLDFIVETYETNETSLKLMLEYTGFTEKQEQLISRQIVLRLLQSLQKPDLPLDVKRGISWCLGNLSLHPASHDQFKQWTGEGKLSHAFILCGDGEILKNGLVVFTNLSAHDKNDTAGFAYCLDVELMLVAADGSEYVDKICGNLGRKPTINNK